MSETILIPVLIAFSGAALLVIGGLKWRRARLDKHIPCRFTGGLVAGERQFITGAAASPVKVAAPVSRNECVFYLEKTERLESSYGRRANSERWVTEAVTAYGAFFVKDADGAALVMPGRRALDLKKAEFSDPGDALPGMSGGPGAVRRTELTIAEGESVTVLGYPRPLGEFMNFLRSSRDAYLSADLVKRLTEMEKDPALAATPCFFGDGVELVTDQPHSEYVAGSASSGAFLLQAGAVLLAGGVLAFLYLLKSSLPSGDPY